MRMASYTERFERLERVLRTAEIERLAGFCRSQAGSDSRDEASCAVISAADYAARHLLRRLQELRGISFEETGLTDEAEHTAVPAGAHLCLQVLDATRPVTRSDADLMGRVAAVLPPAHILLAVDGMERIDPAERDEVVSYIREKIAAAGVGGSRLFFLSSRTGEGLVPLLDALRALAITSTSVMAAAQEWKLSWVVKASRAAIEAQIEGLGDPGGERQATLETLCSEVLRLYRVGARVTLFLNTEEDRHGNGITGNYSTSLGEALDAVSLETLGGTVGRPPAGEVGSNLFDWYREALSKRVEATVGEARAAYRRATATDGADHRLAVLRDALMELAQIGEGAGRP